MKDYDLPVQHVSPSPSRNVRRAVSPRSRRLGRAALSTAALALLAGIFTLLRFVGLLSPLFDAIRDTLGV